MLGNVATRFSRQDSAVGRRSAGNSRMPPEAREIPHEKQYRKGYEIKNLGWLRKRCLRARAKRARKPLANRSEIAFDERYPFRECRARLCSPVRDPDRNRLEQDQEAGA
jgi:hypothetical protein